MSSHREAPEISKDPVADNTDLYAFVDPNDASKVTIEAAAELLSDAKVDERVMDRLRAERVRAVVGRLPPEQREVLALAFWGGYSQSEIAARTGTPLGTVKSRVRLAMNKLRESLEDER